MRRLALLLAASVLGTGCVASSTPPCTHTVSIGWPSFLLAGGLVTPSCATAGVTSVDVFMNDVPVKRVPCSDGGMSVVDVPGGSQRFTVEGLDASGTVVLLRDEFTVNASVCGEQLVDSQPAEGTFTLSYSFASGGSCAAAGSKIVFSLLDQTTGLAADYQSTCSDVISFALPTGPYVLRRVEELDSTGAIVYAANCAATSFSLHAAAESIVTVVLPDSPNFCPASAGPAATERPKMLAPATKP